MLVKKREKDRPLGRPKRWTNHGVPCFLRS